jgi:hypothetical protein
MIMRERRPRLFITLAGLYRQYLLGVITAMLGFTVQVKG